MIMDELDIFAGWSVVDILLTYLYSWRLDHNDPIPNLRSYSIDIVIVGFATPMATVFAIVITAMYGNKSIVRRSVCSNGRRAVRL